MTEPARALAERHLDVRDDIARGIEPWPRIVAAIAELGPDEALVLHAPFEPTPLYRAMGARGFAHRAERRAPADWWVWLYRDPGAVPVAGPAAPPPVVEAPPRGGSVPLDVRGLEPPWPMVRILEAIERLGPGDRIEVLHDRRPLFLYPQLDARGFRHVTDEIEAGRVRITIWRDAAPP